MKRLLLSMLIPLVFALFSIALLVGLIDCSNLVDDEVRK